MLITEIKWDLHKWWDIPYPCIRRPNITKTSIFLKLNHRLNAIAIRIPIGLFLDIRQVGSKIHVERQRKWNIFLILEKEVSERNYTTWFLRLTLKLQ